MNIKTNVFALPLLFAALFFLQSCDPVSTYEVYLDNRTSDTLWLNFNSADSALYQFSDTLILPGELLELKEWELRGKNRNYDCETFRSGISISTSDGRTSTQDGTELIHWSSIYTREALLWQCYLQIKDEDLQ